MWIDRIYDAVISMYHTYKNPHFDQVELFAIIFTAIWLHEHIHALFDLQYDEQKEAFYSTTNGNRKPIPTLQPIAGYDVNEETIDNAIVLWLYYGNGDVYMFRDHANSPIVYDFISSQPNYYREAANIFPSHWAAILRGLSDIIESKQ